MIRAIRIACVCLGLVVAAAAQSPSGKPFFSKQILLGAHRGGANEWPENTVVAFTEAVKAHPEILLETDARLTSDGHVVLLHDKTVDRTTNGTGAVTALTLEQVKALDAGHDFSLDGGATFPYRGKGLTIPTLKEALEATPNSHILVELKGEAALANAAVAVIKAAGAEDRVLFASFVPTTMERARAIAPNMAYCYDMKTGTSLLMALRSPRWSEYVPQAEVLSMDESMIPQYNLTADEIKAIQAKGIRFQVHTINDSARMTEFLQQGVDSILTDNPGALAKAIAENAHAAK